MGIFERFLSLWVALAIAAGVGLGLLFPDLFASVARLEVANVNLVVALLIWLMIYPMMLKVEPSCLKEVGKKPKGLALTLGINWMIKPFTMTALAILFFQHIFTGLVPAADAVQYIAGMILLGVAPCTAMVFVWSNLTDGDPNYTLVQVTVNDLILVFAFAPIAGLLLGVTDLTVPWGTLLASVLIFIVIPLGAGMLTRNVLMGRGGEDAVEGLAAVVGVLIEVPVMLSLVALANRTRHWFPSPESPSSRG